MQYLSRHVADTLNQPLDMVLFAAHPQPLWVYELGSLRFLAVNDEALARYGYTREEFLGMTVADLHPADDLAAFREALKCRPAGTAVSGPWQHLRKDGTRVMVEVSGHDTLFAGLAARLVAVQDLTERLQTQAVLQSERTFSAAVLDTVGALVAVMDRQGTIVRFNKACEALTGYSEAEVLGRHVGDLFLLPEELSGVRRMFERLCAGIFPCAHENLWVAKDGSRHQISWSNTAMLDAAGQVEFVIATGIDVTEQRQMEASLAAAQHNYQAIFENALEGIFQTTAEGRFLAVNPALAALYGYDFPEDLKEHLTDVRHQLYANPRDRERFAEAMHSDGTVSGFEVEVMRKDGSLIWIAERARTVCDPQGTLLYYEGTVQDITARKRLEAERENLLEEAVARAERDPLTGLLNHRTFHKQLGEEADRAQRTGQPLTIAVMDLDNFKFFNDAYGHASGDDVLRQVSEALAGACRSYDTLARFGGDEFAILMPNTPPSLGADLARRLRERVAGIGYCPPGYDTTIPLGLSVGVATLPEDAPTRLEALNLADTRLLRAKTGEGEDEMAATLRASLMSSVSGFSMLDALVAAVDNKDRYTRHHSEDVMTLCLQIADEMAMDAESRHTLAVAALLHDVGKIGVPDRILRKPGSLNDDEFGAVQQHPMMGAIIVGAVAGLEDTLDCVRHHHERWDGDGYPFGLAGEAIPLLARVMAVADAYSAMTMDRPYRKAKGEAQALDILLAGAGAQWDRACVQAMLRARRALAKSRRTVGSSTEELYVPGV